MAPSEQRASKGGQQVADALDLLERDGSGSAQRGQNGIAKQRRKMKKAKRAERRAARAARAEAQADAEGSEGNEEPVRDGMEAAKGAADTAPAVSTLKKKRSDAKRGGSKRRLAREARQQAQADADRLDGNAKHMGDPREEAGGAAAFGWQEEPRFSAGEAGAEGDDVRSQRLRSPGISRARRAGRQSQTPCAF